jgi:L-ascorbate metabolism protein UlaG (beta-lactamase superfamily)
MISIQWLGAAGFRIRAQEKSFLIDPCLSGGSRGRRGGKRMDPEEIASDVILVTHGHVDHAGDLSEILAASRAEVLCNSTVATRLLDAGVPRERVIPVDAGTRYFHGDYRVEVFPASHAPLDARVLMRGLLRGGTRFFRAISLMRQFPAGSSLSFRLCVFSGCRIQHFGSGGTTRGELDGMNSAGSLDILLLPFLRRAGWVEELIQHVRILKPRIVIPHHHDDSMPPLTEALDIRPAMETLAKVFPGTRVVRLRAMEVFRLTTW